LANFGKDGRPERIIAKVSQETLAETIGTTRSRVSKFMNKFRKLGFIDCNGHLEVHSSLSNPPTLAELWIRHVVRYANKTMSGELDGLLLIACTLVVMGLLLFAMGGLPRLLLSYQIRDRDIRVLLFNSIPIYWIPFRKIVRMHEAPFYEVALVPGVHLFTRAFAQRVVIEMRDRWFIFAFLTPIGAGVLMHRHELADPAARSCDPQLLADDAQRRS
jgi:hypothetical protein